jgi:8-oxo-dGTP pyrophosphatase MutT (NUDIX family)
VNPDRTTVGIVLLNEQGEILMQLRDEKPTITDPGLWVVPGGGQEPGESLEVTARREMLEETGYVLDDIELVYEHDRDRGGGVMEHQVFFKSSYDGVQPVKCFEGQRVEFVPFERLASLELVPGLRTILARLLHVDVSERSPTT